MNVACNQGYEEVRRGNIVGAPALVTRFGCVVEPRSGLGEEDRGNLPELSAVSDATPGCDELPADPRVGAPLLKQNDRVVHGSGGSDERLRFA